MDAHITIIRERLLNSQEQMNPVTEESQFQGCVFWIVYEFGLAIDFAYEIFLDTIL